VSQVAVPAGEGISDTIEGCEGNRAFTALQIAQFKLDENFYNTVDFQNFQRVSSDLGLKRWHPRRRRP